MTAAKGGMQIYKSATIDGAKTDGKAGFIKVGFQILKDGWEGFDQGIYTQMLSLFDTYCQNEKSDRTKGGAAYIKVLGDRVFKILADPTKS